MKKIKFLLLALLLCTPLVASAGDIEINEENFPDKYFRTHLLRQSYGADGVLTEEEINEITSLNLNGLAYVADLKGIEYFTELKYLDCSRNMLTTLDFSIPAGLLTLTCSSNPFIELDLSKFPELTELNCYYCNQLTTINVSNCIALTSLACQEGQVMALDVSNCPALINLSCFDNQLTVLDVSNNKELKTINCSKNQLASLDVTNNKELTNINCSNNQLAALDISTNHALTYLTCSNNQIAVLDVSNNPALTSLKCDGNQLVALDLSNNIEVENVDCSRNKIKGASMDALISSLPQQNDKWFIVYDITRPDENVCTKTQVKAVKAKGWIPFYCSYYNGFDQSWKIYDGVDDDDPTAITRPITETVEANIPAYTLSGQKVTGSLKGKKGVYIVGGKKVVIK